MMLQRLKSKTNIAGLAGLIQMLPATADPIWKVVAQTGMSSETVAILQWVTALLTASMIWYGRDQAVAFK